MTRAAFWLGAVVAGAGCHSTLAAINQKSHTVTYRKEGFTVEDIRRKFTHDALKRRERAELEARLTLVDDGMDGTVDTVTDDTGSEWQRGEAHSEGLFSDADRKFAAVREYLRIEGYLTQWREMSPETIAQRNGLGVRD